jgi:hypothetical protein
VACFGSPRLWHSDGLNVSAYPMTQEQDTHVKRAYREFWDAKEALDALEAACVEISESSSITTEEGFLILTASGVLWLCDDTMKSEMRF